MFRYLIFIIFILFPLIVFAKDKVTEIKDLNEEIADLKVQHQNKLDSLENDPDIQLWRRIQEKNAQQRAIADEIIILENKKQELLKSEEVNEVQPINLINL